MWHRRVVAVTIQDHCLNTWFLNISRTEKLMKLDEIPGGYILMGQFEWRCMFVHLFTYICCWTLWFYNLPAMFVVHRKRLCESLGLNIFLFQCIGTWLVSSLFQSSVVGLADHMVITLECQDFTDVQQLVAATWATCLCLSLWCRVSFSDRLRIFAHQKIWRHNIY